MKKILAVILLSLTILILYSSTISTASVTLAWDPNTEPDIAGYKIYYGTPVGNYTEVVNCGNTTNTTIQGLFSGMTYAFYATCYNTSGLESEPSNVVEYEVPSDVVFPMRPGSFYLYDDR